MTYQHRLTSLEEISRQNKWRFLAELYSGRSGPGPGRVFYGNVAGRRRDHPRDPFCPHRSRAHVARRRAGSGEAGLGSKVSPEFRNKVQTIASSLGTDPNFLMSAMAFETGRSFSASQANKAGSGAVGLIQFMPSTAKSLGTTSAALAAMTAEDQLDFVQTYFARFAGKLHSISDLYMAILWPVAVPQPNNFVLFSQDISPKAYQQNKGLDLDGDGKVTKAEAASRVAAMLVEGLKRENVG